MWEFAVGLFMVEIWKKSLLLTSLYGLVETASVAALGVILGEWVDRFPRLKVIQTSLALQNVSLLSATLAILLLLLKPQRGGGFIVFSCLVGLVNVLGGVSALASLATKISLERDWFDKAIECQKHVVDAVRKGISLYDVTLEEAEKKLKELTSQAKSSGSSNG